MNRYGYAVYEAPEGSCSTYLGWVRTLREARALAAADARGEGRGTSEAEWGTAMAAGASSGLLAPGMDSPGECEEEEEPREWFGRGGVYCAIPLRRRVADKM